MRSKQMTKGFSRREVLTGTGLSALAVMLPGFEAQAAVDTAKVTIPAGPGGGWDRTGRLTMRAMQNEKLVSAVQFKKRPGWGWHDRSHRVRAYSEGRRHGAADHRRHHVEQRHHSEVANHHRHGDAAGQLNA